MQSLTFIVGLSVLALAVCPDVLSAQARGRCPRCKRYQDYPAVQARPYSKWTAVDPLPITITIVEYRLPQPKGVNPKSGSPGTHVVLDCPDFHTDDLIVLTDASEKVTQIGSHGTGSTFLKVPQGTAEGVLTIQIGNSQYGNQLSEPVTFLVSTDLLPLELAPENITPVAPGQWLDLQVSNSEPLLRSELTEVNFKQSGRSIVGTAPNLHRPHVAVPRALSAGKVQLEVRTSQNGRASLWSETVTIQLTEKVVAPVIDAIRLEKDNWVQLWPGLDRAKTFSASAEDVIVLHGSFPVADATPLPKEIASGAEPFYIIGAIAGG